VGGFAPESSLFLHDKYRLGEFAPEYDFFLQILGLENNYYWF